MARLRYTSLGSGSEGNALVVEAVDAGGAVSRVLLDCGFGLRDITHRLEARGIPPDALDAILVTHEHSDHCAGVLRLARRHGIRVHCSYGTWSALLQPAGAEGAVEVRVQHVCSHTAFDVRGLHIHPFPVPHDAREPTQFVFTDGVRRLGVLTDAGSATPCMIEMLGGCDALVLECNHDAELLARSDYPDRLKRRIAGNFGHLSNAAAAALLESVDRSRLKRLHAAHLSRQNNRADLATAALARVLGARLGEIGIATQHDGFDWVVL